MKQKIGAQLYTLRDKVTTEEGFCATMQKLGELGYRYVQFSGVTAPLTPRRVREILDANGLTICCTHMPWERLLKEPEQVAEENLVMGNSIVGVSNTGHPLTTLEDVREYIGQIQQVGRVMQEYGLTFAIHNHTDEFHRYGGRSVLQMVREETDPAAVEFIFCCFWALAAGADPVAYLREFAGRVRCCHYKDMTMLNRERAFAPVGQGNMNYRAIWQACEETGVQYALIEQDVCQKDPLICMEESRAYMQTLGEAYDREQGV